MAGTMKIGTLEVDIGADTAPLDAAEAEVRQTAKKMETVWQRTGGRVTDQFKRMGGAARRMATNVQVSRAQLQQTAFQVQDFTAQVANGTNALVAFSQQVPQALGAFGPGGAVLGAILGVASAIGALLIPSLFSAREETDTLAKATEELDDVLTDAAEGGVKVLTKRIVELAAESRDAAIVQIKAGMVRAIDEMGQAAKDATALIDEMLGAEFGRRIERGIEDFDKAETVIRELGWAFGITFSQADDLFDRVEEFRQQGTVESLERLQQTVNELTVSSQTATPELASFAAGLSVSTDAARTATDNLSILTDAEQDLTTAVNTATEALTREERALQARRRAIAEARQERAAEAEAARRERGIEGIERLGESSLDQIAREAEERRAFILEQDQLTAQKRAELLNIVQLDREAKVDAHNERLAQTAQSAARRQSAVSEAQTISALQNLATLATSANDIMQAAGQEGTAVAKAIFLAQKAIQVASIISATEVAAANAGAVSALAGPFAFFATSSGIRALGYANAALVAGLSVGQTFGGGRQFGGTVSPRMAHPINEGGTPEILNMAGRQFLLPTGMGGTITPMDTRSGSSGQANVTIISNGTPQTVTGTRISRGEVAVMIDDKIRNSEQRTNASLRTGRGDTAASLRRGWQVERRL